MKKGRLIARQVYPHSGISEAERAAAKRKAEAARQWFTQHHPNRTTRTFQRDIRVDGLRIPVTVLVVREKEESTP